MDRSREKSCEPNLFATAIFSSRRGGSGKMSNPHVFLEIRIGLLRAGRIEIELLHPNPCRLLPELRFFSSNPGDAQSHRCSTSPRTTDLRIRCPKRPRISSCSALARFSLCILAPEDSVSSRSSARASNVHVCAGWNRQSRKAPALQGVQVSPHHPRLYGARRRLHRGERHGRRINLRGQIRGRELHPQALGARHAELR